MQAFKWGGLLLLAASLGGVAGAWMVGRAGDNAPSPATTGPQAIAPPTPREAALKNFSGPVQWGEDEALGLETARVLKDPEYLREVLRRYNAEADTDKRAEILTILQSAANDDVLRFSRQLLQGTDKARRRDGLALLRAYPLDKPEARTLLVAQIGGERDPAMLTQMVEMLSPAFMPTEDAAPVVQQLALLRRNPDPQVRAASLLKAMEWDKGGDIEAMLHAALLDPASEVQQAAIAGVGAANVRSDRVKQALLGIISNPRSADPERGAAISTLRNFPLDRAEYALYELAASEYAVGQ
ncbi:MAG: hypothetical protein EOP92_12990 [Lysobacteraceae bacterium]|nr:MAG: hypothetical protein EOP92_12990 [Xanthomonadaceae bacterium]